MPASVLTPAPAHVPEHSQLILSIDELLREHFSALTQTIQEISDRAVAILIASGHPNSAN